jgi:hypothetical protein
MKREEANDKMGIYTYWDDGSELLARQDVDRIVDKIFDDFESRTCENCNNYIDRYCGVVCYFVNSKPEKTRVLKDFCCNQWEAK